MENIFYYKVLRGENIFSIANKFDISPFAIIKDNGLKSETYEGELLIIKKGKKIVLYPEKSLDEYCLNLKDLEEINGIDYLPYIIPLLY